MWWSHLHKRQCLADQLDGRPSSRPNIVKFCYTYIGMSVPSWQILIITNKEMLIYQANNKQSSAKLRLRWAYFVSLNDLQLLVIFIGVFLHRGPFSLRLSFIEVIWKIWMQLSSPLPSREFIFHNWEFHNCFRIHRGTPTIGRHMLCWFLDFSLLLDVEIKQVPIQEPQ